MRTSGVGSGSSTAPHLTRRSSPCQPATPSPTSVVSTASVPRGTLSRSLHERGQGGPAVGGRRPLTRGNSSSRWDRRLDLAPQNFAGRPLRQRVDDPHLPRVLIARESFLDEVPDLVRMGGCPRSQSYGGADLLTEGVVGNADDGGLNDGWMLIEHFLDLARIHVVPAADDQRLLAVDDVEVAFLVHPSEIAGAEPAIRGRYLGGGRWLSPIALHDVVAADGDLADVADRQVGPVVSHDSHLHSVDRDAD